MLIAGRLKNWVRINRRTWKTQRMSMFRQAKRAVFGRTSEKAPFLMLPKRDLRSPSRYLAVTTIVKDEGPYLREWLEFQRLLGVEHAYLYDNGSSDNSATVLAPFVAEGFVTVIPWRFPWHLDDRGVFTAQALAFAHFITNFGSEWRWIAFIDVDEFLFPVSGHSLPKLLADYEDLPALVAFWTMFGTSGHQTPPKGLVIENYTMRAPFPTHALPKSIVDPSTVLAIRSIHMFRTTAGESAAYNEHRQLVTRENMGVLTSDIFRLNHYYTRSQAECEAKVAARAASGIKKTAIMRGKNRLYIEPSAHNVPDHSILQFVPKLKQLMSSPASSVKSA
jgi:hypothetical protein